MKVPGTVVSVSAVFLALLLLVPLSARAQMRTAPMGGAHPAMHAARVQPRATHIIRAERVPIATAAPRQFHSTNLGVPPPSVGNGYGVLPGETLGQLLNPVPGLGFDYSHLNVINADLGIKAVIDPETEWRLSVAERVARATGGFGTGGYYLLDGGADYAVPAESEPAADQPQESQQAPQPTFIVLQEKAQQPATEQEPSVAPQPATPLPNISNFTLVLQNGKKIEAIAFTRVGDQVVYITSDGARHAIPASELNPSATEQLNADRGTQFRL
jgi:hypothetical protein